MIIAALRISGAQVPRIPDSIALSQSYLHDKNRLGAEIYLPPTGSMAFKHGVELHLIQPGKSTQNGFIEDFNGRLRDEYQNEYEFSNMIHTRKIINGLQQDYNECRPDSSLNCLSLSRSDDMGNMQKNQPILPVQGCI